MAGGDSEPSASSNSNGTVEAATEELPGEEEEKGSGVRFPLARIKRIMKADPELGLASQDAVFLVAKATELFVESLALEAYHYTSQAKKKTVSRRDVDHCIDAIEAMAFLDGAMD
ncbi:DNA polymerase epsilon subunit 4-like [Penaeus chinensis]|uniref:DNA polymerase epsilon subunit 4-like n=1 Tax=Penaeus chinensis TaxID=139456 RepID=UPI001FB74B30|nr:DNA polymerase epsilon subunit 4-like [Penaeus chinensis]